MSFYRVPWAPVESRRNGARNPCIGVVNSSLQGTRGTLSSPAATYTRLTITDALVAMMAQRVESATTTTAESMPVVPGDTITLQAQARTTTAAGMHLQLQFVTAANATVGASVVGGVAPASGAFADIPPVSAVAPATAAFVRWAVGLAATGARAVSQILDVQRVMLEKAAVPLPFFSGATPATTHPPASYAWAAAANASPSIMSVPSPADRLDPVLPVVVPHKVERETRTIVHVLADSEATRTTHIPPNPRSGTLTAVFATPDAAFAAVGWFSTPHDYLLEDDAGDYADLRFVVAGGKLEVEQGEAGDAVLRIPFVEVTG